MAFTNVWSNVIPAGSDALSTADNQIRQLRLDIQERMEGGLVDDWTTDPLVLTRLVAGLTGPPDVARVWPGAAINVLTGVEKVIDFIQESFDTGSFHDNGTNPSRLTITTAAYYRIRASFRLTGGATEKSGFFRIKKNGSIIAGHDVYAPGSSFVVAGASIETTDLAAATDYYEVSIEQSSGNTWILTNSQTESFFEIFRLPGTT